VKEEEEEEKEGEGDETTYPISATIVPMAPSL
jgi:hypothetical protein